MIFGGGGGGICFSHDTVLAFVLSLLQFSYVESLDFEGMSFSMALEFSYFVYLSDSFWCSTMGVEGGGGGSVVYVPLVCSFLFSFYLFVSRGWRGFETFKNKE